MTSGVEHFDGSLPSYFTSVTASAGTVTISDSNLVCDVPTTNDAAFVYYNTKLNKTVAQMHTFCFRTSNLFINNAIYLINRSGVPIADTFNNFDGQGVTRGGFLTTGGFNFAYWNTGGTRNSWDNVTQTWQSDNSKTAIDTLEVEDYVLLTLEIDPNLGAPRFRWIARGRTGSAFNQDQAERLSAVTDWLSFSNVRTNTDLWLTFGFPYTDQTDTGTLSCEYYRYAIDTNVKDYCWTNARDSGAANWTIRAAYSYDYQFYVPVDRTTKALDVGTAGQWDDGNIHGPWVVKDGASYYMFYSGDDGSGFMEIGLATASGPEGPWTKASGNPVVPRSNGTNRNDIARPTVWRDLAEPDQSKTWKMLFTGFSSIDSKWRIYYATAPAPSGTWTVTSTEVLGPGSSGQFDERGCQMGTIVWDGSKYYVWYAGQASTTGIKWSIGLATSNGADITTLTKDTTNNPYIPRAVDAKQVITSQSARTSNMTDTTGFVKDQPVIIDQDATSSQWIQTRVRKITTNTSVECYNKPAGITGNTAEMAAFSYGSMEIRAVRYINGVWYFYVSPFAIHSAGNGDNFDCNAETSGLLYSTNLTDTTKTWNWLATPFNPLSQSIGQLSRGSSNENACFVTTALGIDATINGRARRGIGRHK